MCKYDKFCENMKHWKEWFDSEKRRCIVYQVQQILFDAYIFKLLNRAYELSDTETTNGKEIVKKNQMIFWFIDRTYVHAAHIDIRRLLFDKDEISLKTLLKKIKNQNHLLTRENYAKKFDYFINLDKHKVEYAKKISSRISSYKSGGEIADPFIIKYDRSARFHERFDKLCNKNKDDREPKDIIGIGIYDTLNSDLQKCEDLIRDVADKVFAHTDKKKFGDDIYINFSDIFDAIKLLASVVKFVSLNLLCNYEISMLPSPPINWHKYLHEPLVDEKDHVEISKIWQVYSQEINS